MQPNLEVIIICIFIGIVFFFILVAKILFKGLSPEIFIARKALESQGIEISNDELKLHKDAGGNIMNVVRKIVEAKQAGKEMTFQEACALDLTG